MDSVCEQGDRAAEQHDDELQHRGAQQDEQADLERPDALTAGLKRVVDRVGRVVGVWHEQVVEETLESGRVAVPVVVVVIVIVIVIVNMPVVVPVIVVVLVPVIVLVQCRGHAVFSSVLVCLWWCRGLSPRACSAWKIAS